jgi:hypothetical protein
MLDAAHGGDGVTHDRAGAAGRLLGLGHHAACLGRPFGGAAHRRGDLVEGGGGFLQRGRLLLRAMGELVGGGGKLAGIAGDRAGSGQDAGHRAAQRQHGAIDVGLELGEIALEVAGHLLRQVGMRERGDHAAHFADAAIDILDQLVDARGEAAKVFVLIGLGDAAREVAGGSGRDDRADVRLQVLALCLEGGFLGFHFAHLHLVGAEDVEGARHGADLVLALGAGDVVIELAGGEVRHHAGQKLDRPDDAVAGEEHAEQHAGDDTDEGGCEQQDLRRRRTGDCGGARFRQCGGGVGRVFLERGGNGLLAFQRLVERGENGGAVLALVRAGDGHHGADILEIGRQCRTNAVEQLLLIGIGRGGDLRQAVEHFLGALLRLGGEVCCLFRGDGELVGHAADGDDVDAQVHGFTGHFFPRSGVRKGGTQRGQAAAADSGDGAGGKAHQQHEQADFPGNREIRDFHGQRPQGRPSPSWRASSQATREHSGSIWHRLSNRKVSIVLRGGCCFGR